MSTAYSSSRDDFPAPAPASGKSVQEGVPIEPDAEDEVERRHRPTDLRLLPLAGGLWVAAAAVLSRSGQDSGPTAIDAAYMVVGGGLVGLAMAVVVALGLVRKRMPVCASGNAIGRPRVGLPAVVVLLVGLISGGILAGLHSAALAVEPIPELIRARSTVDAVVVTKTEPRVWSNGSGSVRRSWTARVVVTELRRGEAVFRLRAPVLIQGFTVVGSEPGQMLPGTTVRVTGTLGPGRPGRPESARLSIRGEPETIVAEPWWQRWAGEVRASLRNASAGLSADAAGLLPGLAVGDERALPDELADSMRSVGMSHLTAVSGSNLAIVTGLVLLLMRACRLPRLPAVAVAGVAMLGFVVVVGFEPSVQRAAVMGGIALLGVGLGRRRVGLSALLAAVSALLLIDPWLALSWGFALSVAATAGLLVGLTRSDDRWRAGGSSRSRRLLRDALTVALVCQLATAPLVAAMGNGISPVGVLANAAATPAVPMVTVLGLLAAVVGLLQPAVAAWLAGVAGLGATWIGEVARHSARFPGAVVPWPGGVVGALSVSVVIAVGVLGVARSASVISRRCSRSRDPGARTTGRHRFILVIFLVAMVVIGARLMGAVGTGSWPPPRWSIAFCDVGQGDATVLKSADGHAVVVDVGLEPGPVDRCLRDLGIWVIDLLVLTHFHADHVMGLPGAMGGRTVGRVVVSPLRDPPGTARQVDGWLAGVGLTADPAAVGEEGRVGAVGYRIVWPRRKITSGSIANNSSVTLLAEVDGITVLLPGDLEPVAQQALMDSLPPPRVAVMKIPHHGSKFQHPGLVAWSGSKVAVASAGRGNDHGHPAEETLSAWSKSGATVRRTDLDGDIALGVDPDEDPSGSLVSINVWARNRDG